MDRGLFLLRVGRDPQGGLVIELRAAPATGLEGSQVVRFADWNALGRYVEEALAAEAGVRRKKPRSRGLR
ncbi:MULTISPECIES: hypothetical protein [unclassified Meiothermus]|uniref:hypothetical protein n=1 Tax=unclassified Meiothermus TaxID=370471 RepID=UPI000D7CFA03|nr:MULTISPECIES: hypothetical protein [unclassified Meiothermus]PZA05776.1 hypothetical protein DNA98_16860 [Meiothermus sp. Pnk-1]RYM31512.1 hypothetical protein EWH23_14580 [Meiothermus sp. PNK-Is4]